MKYKSISRITATGCRAKFKIPAAKGDHTRGILIKIDILPSLLQLFVSNLFAIAAQCNHCLCSLFYNQLQSHTRMLYYLQQSRKSYFKSYWIKVNLVYSFSDFYNLSITCEEV